MGLFGPDDTIEITVPAHGTRVLRLIPWDGEHPKIIGTDCHITGGACEILECTIGTGRIEGKIASKWNYPVVVTAGFPTEAGGITIVKSRVPAGETHFAMSCQG